MARENHTVVGRLYEERGIAFVVAETRRINQDLLVPVDDRGGAKSGDVVVVEIVQQPSPQREAIARVVEVLGRLHRSRHGNASRCASTERRTNSRRGAQTAQAAAGHRPRSGRPRRHPALPLVTIDGGTAKDFDDAVYCEREGEASG